MRIVWAVAAGSTTMLLSTSSSDPPSIEPAAIAAGQADTMHVDQIAIAESRSGFDDVFGRRPRIASGEGVIGRTGAWHRREPRTRLTGIDGKRLRYPEGCFAITRTRSSDPIGAGGSFLGERPVLWNLTFAGAVEQIRVGDSGRSRADRQTRRVRGRTAASGSLELVRATQSGSSARELAGRKAEVGARRRAHPAATASIRSRNISPTPSWTASLPPRQSTDSAHTNQLATSAAVEPGTDLLSGR